ncbi:MAG TPA: nicotinamide-nucleotide amidohydrolase family protein [Propionibacteriaceae bacterium]|nr:nicotinamide-nucleotide amidohydrolase family protein [Propionibacteriaceae bacterium]
MTSAIAREVISRLVERGETLATAESLTGGLIGSLITEVPGASAHYVGGAITYATGLKATLAGVPRALLDADGPVAESTARAMATGIAARCAADWGLAVTGVAGPDPQDGHPVGEVYMAVAYQPAGWVRSRRLALAGDRATIRGQTAHQGLRLLANELSTAEARPVSASTAMSVVD